MRLFSCCRRVTAIVFLVAIGGLARAEDAAPANAAAPAEPDRALLEKQFAETMTGATLRGCFTMTSLSDAPCKDDKSAPAKNEQPSGEKPGDSSAQESGKGSGKSANEAPLKEDSYTLGQVRKLEGDNWLIEARIQYGGHDVTVPLMLKVRWAGDTPVITLTDFSIPGLGVFTSRVLFYRGQYAGTWRHGEHGGEMFGRVLPAKAH